MNTSSSSFGRAILIVTAVSGCGHHHVNPPAAPYIDRAVWVQPTSGCNDSSAKRLPPFRVSDTITRSGADKDLQERTAWLARRVPGGLAFGRVFDDSHHPIIRLTDPTRKLAALATLDSLDPRRGRSRLANADSIRAVRVRWDFAELYDWMKYLQSSFGEAGRIPINGSGIDTQNDRIEFDVETRESLPVLVNWLLKKGVPCGLVAIRVTGPNRLL